MIEKCLNKQRNLALQYLHVYVHASLVPAYLSCENMTFKCKYNGIQCQTGPVFGEVNKRTSVMSRKILLIDSIKLVGSEEGETWRDAYGQIIN